MSEPTQHPSTNKIMRDAAQRFLESKVEARKSSDLMWAGVLTTQFSDDELTLIASVGLMSQRDRLLLKKAGRELNEPGSSG